MYKVKRNVCLTQSSKPNVVFRSIFLIFEIIKKINFYNIDKFMNVLIDKLKNNILHFDDMFNGFI